ncbi:MAG: DnaJ C-terminal domain-containing protein [Vicinamibacterales bacterium]
MDFYIVLGLQQGASEADIRRAYRRLARRFHPDINPGDREAEARFRQIVEAYETLVDPARRGRYDAGVGTSPPGATRPATGFEGFDFSPGGPGQPATFGDLFADLLVERLTPPVSAGRGADLHHRVTVSFEEALRGVEAVVRLTRRVSCRVCSGRGHAASAASGCPGCGAQGTVRAARGHMIFSRTCPDCGGTGRVRPQPCRACGGMGVEARADVVHVPLPPGVSTGEQVRFGGLGDAGCNGAAPGDLYLTVDVRPHPMYRREGDDLHRTVAVAIHEAALGARIPLDTPDGQVRLRIPPGTQSGQRFRLRGRGAPSTRGERRGDLVVEARVVMPRVLDERSKELLREFGRINDEDVRGGEAADPA